MTLLKDNSEFEISLRSTITGVTIISPGRFYKIVFLIGKLARKQAGLVFFIYKVKTNKQRLIVTVKCNTNHLVFLGYGGALLK